MVSPHSYSHALGIFTKLLMVALPLAYLSNSTASSPAIPSGWRHQISPDAESQLTLGERLPLDHIDVFSLELIEGISDSLAFKILERTHSIQRLAAYLRPERSYRAFEVVKGIGPKTAEKLFRFLDPISINSEKGPVRQPLVTRTDAVEGLKTERNSPNQDT